MSSRESGPQPGRRPIHLPREDFARIKVTPLQLGGRDWTRMFNRAQDPIFFNNRPGNRFTPPDGPWQVLYLGDSTRTCFLETFGDELYSGRNRIARSRWESRGIAEIAVPTAKVCDLTDDRILAALGVDKGALYATDLTVPQAWSRAIMEHPAGFEGILYASRFGEGKCLALFDTPAVATRVRELSREDLHGSMRGDDLCMEFNLALV